MAAPVAAASLMDFRRRLAGLIRQDGPLRLDRFMALFTLLDLSHAFGGPPVLDHVNFQVDAGERVCLIGRNGMGKSTLMRLIAGEMEPDSGSISRQPGAHFARLNQEVPTDVVGPATITAPVASESAAASRLVRSDRKDSLASRCAGPNGMPSV